LYIFKKNLLSNLKSVILVSVLCFHSFLFGNDIDDIMRSDTIPTSFKISYLQKSYQNGIQNQDNPTSFVSALGLVSIYLNQEKNVDSAAYYLAKAYDQLPQITSNRAKSKFYYISGSVELSVKNYEKALAHFIKCREIVYADSDPKTYNLPILFNSIGIAYSNLEQSDSAIFYIEFAYEISVENGDVNFAVQSLGNLANIISEDDLSKLKSIIEKLEKLEQSIDNPILKSRVFQIFSRYYLKKKDYLKAEIYLEKAFDLSKSSEAQLAEVYLDYSNFYEATDDPDQSLLYYKNYIGLRDSLREVNKEIKLANFESFYKSKLREEEIKTEREQFKTFEEQSKVRELWFYAIIIGSVLLLAILGLYFFRLNQITKQRKENFKKEKEIQKLKVENISHELKSKEKELSNVAIDIARRNEFASKVYVDLTSISRKKDPETLKESIKKLQRYVKQQENVNKSLEHLQIETDELNFEFYQKLDQLVSDLTKKEKQLCAFIRLDLSNQDIASLMGISPDTLKNNKSKLKKKFDLDASVDFNSYIAEL
jgi:tetratricopeptide (TPR) repeat protein